MAKSTLKERLLKELKEIREELVETAWEPEEMMRWIARHEYYHLGQLIYNRWLLGYNPYKEP